MQPEGRNPRMNRGITTGWPTTRRSECTSSSKKLLRPEEADGGLPRHRPYQPDRAACHRYERGVQPEPADRHECPGGDDQREHVQRSERRNRDRHEERPMELDPMEEDVHAEREREA